MAGLKRVTMETGQQQAPVIIMDDADIDKAVTAVTATGYANSGQTCISAQRIITSGKVYGDFYRRAQAERGGAHRRQPGWKRVRRSGPLVRERDAERVESWINEAVGAGATLVTGGERIGAVCQPAILADVDPSMRVSCDELFGPAVAITRFDDIDEAINMANSTNYGLSAGIFTQDIDRAMKFAREGRQRGTCISTGPRNGGRT